MIIGVQSTFRSTKEPQRLLRDPCCLCKVIAGVVFLRISLGLILSDPVQPAPLPFEPLFLINFPSKWHIYQLALHKPGWLGITKQPSAKHRGCCSLPPSLAIMATALGFTLPTHHGSLKKRRGCLVLQGVLRTPIFIMSTRRSV